MEGTEYVFREVQQEDDIEFWSEQLKDHCFFLAAGMATDDKIEGTNYTFKQYGFMLERAWIDFQVMYDTNRPLALIHLEQLVDDTAFYKGTVLTHLNAGQWLGWIFPTFADHILRELEYFRGKLQGSIKTEMVTNFWNEIDGDHAAFAAHLLDPKEQKYIEMADRLKDEFAMLPQDDLTQFIVLSLKAAEDVDGFQSTAQALMERDKLKSIIHPRLIHHVIRENKRGQIERGHVLSLL